MVLEFRLGQRLASRCWRVHSSRLPASRLSYFLWDSMPDAQLFQSAAAGELDSPAGIEKAVRRMLEDSRARQSVDEFVSQWLRFDRLLNTVKDRRQFPAFTPEMAGTM